MRSLRLVVMLLFVLAVTAVSLSAQTASTSTVTGTVFDQTGAVVPKATVELTDVGTNAKRTTTTGNDGQYFFPLVLPGNYKITVTVPGFRQSVISGLKVEVGKAALVNVTLAMGEVTQVVEVQAGAATTLQTTDASVGNVLDHKILENMPTLSRDALSLLLLQPTAIPAFNGPLGTTYGESSSAGGGVSGAREDQNTFLLDGGDATSNMEGGGGYNTGFIGTSRAVVPTPIESLEEFRVQTNNQNASFTRSSGAAVQMVTRRGTNAWHGAAYWYHQNDETNANDWVRNRIGRENPELRDNRYGGRLGGPIWKDRTFFFVHEEERHFLQQATFTRLVPTAAMRAGILEVQNAAKNIVAFNLNPIPTMNPGACGGVSSGAGCPSDPNAGMTIASSGLDPRGLGLNPAIAATWAKLPLPNDFSQGDQLRTAGFTSAVPDVSNEHFAVVRLDHKISSKWDFDASYRYSTTERIVPNYQVDIGGVLPGDTLGKATAVSPHPLQPRYLVASLIGRLTPNLTNEFHFDWLRHWWAWFGPGPVNPISTTLSDAPLQIYRENTGGSSGLVPLNVDTQRARLRSWNGRDFTFIDNLSLLKGKHLWEFGGRAQRQHLFHSRDDKVIGGLTTPVYYVAKGGQFSNIGGIPVPAAVQSTDATSWKRAYISVLGLVDSGTQVLTRDANLNPLPPFSLITQDSIINSYELHFSDTVRMTPSFTFTWGLTWGVQLPPFETTGKQMMVVDAGSGQFVSPGRLLNAESLAGSNGAIVNPALGYLPIRNTGRKYPYDPDWTNLGPRLSAAWNPSFTSGFLGSMLGDRKTVLRGGWSRAFDRVNGVGIVLTPALGLGFGDLSVCTAPVKTGGGVVCAGSSNPSTAFRIGVDGNHVPIPTLPTISGTPIVIPGQGAAITGPGGTIPGTTVRPNSIYENTDYRIDPNRSVGGSDMIDFTIQRQLPGQMLLEVGYVGRWGRDLPQFIDLNSVPYMFKPKGVNQTFAQAFDIVDAQVRAGVPLSQIPPQPWFEAMLGPGGTANAAGQCGMGVHGAGAVFFAIEPFFVNGPGGTPLPATHLNTQVNGINYTLSNGISRYHAGFVTLRKRPSQGLTFDLGYTFSHSLDDLGLNQESTCTLSDAFNPSRTYASSAFDRRHVFNALVTYELPFGKGKHFATGGVADRVFGGWSFSSIYTAASGLPIFVYDNSTCATEFGTTAQFGEFIGLIPVQPGVVGTSRVNNPTITSLGKSGVPNAFSDPAKVAASFRYPTFADGRLGMGAVRGLFRWNFDFGLAKTTRITERVSTRFDVQLVNAFNHPMLAGFSNVFGTGTVYSTGEPNLDLADPSTFGALSQQFNAPRYIQFGLRLDF